VIKLHDVSIKYPGALARALDEINLDITKGEFIVLRGPSGSGKTTLLFLLAGMLRPTDGDITISDQKLSDLSAEQKSRFRAENIGFVFQMFHLVPYLTVTENVKLAVVKGKPKSDSVSEILKTLGLEEKVASLPSELSAGEKQRTAIARAMVNRPQLLLADEPTGNLDTENARSVLSSLEEIHHRGATVIVASHDSMADTFADRIIELKDGKIVGITA
jgi:ABC-type lipoprotein export system ATPase subunit